MIANIKWDQNHQSRIKAFAKDLDENKNKQVGALLTEGDALQTEKTALTKEIRQLKDEQKGLSSVFRYQRHAKTDYDRLNDGVNKTTHNPRQEAFLGTNTTGTKYQTNGWLKKVENHFKPTSGKLDNLYKVKISSTDYETTEEQVIQLIARVVKALQKIDSTDFEAKYNAKETDTSKQGKVKTYLKEIQDQEIIVSSDKDGKQKSYDFANTYQKYDKDTKTWTAYTAPTFNYQHFFEFINLTHRQAFLNDLDTDKQKNIDKNESWQIFLKGEKWEAKQLKDYGITIDDSKTELYKVSETDKQTIPAGNGIVGWLDLAHSFTQDSNNQTKLIAAFNDSPTQQLLSDLKTWTLDNGFLTDGTFTLPESLEGMEDIMDELETKKINNSAEQAQIAKQIKAKNDELKTKQTDLTQKEAELGTLIKEIITKQRAKLTPYKISDGFADQHKRTESELWQIQQILKNIRFLEKGEETSPSSETAENTAYDQIVDLQNQLNPYFGKPWLVRYFADLAFKKDEKSDINQAIERIKAGKYADSESKEHKIYQDLAQFYSHFEQKAQLVKLSEWEEQAQTALKAAIEKKDDTEQLPDWQAKLKALDPLITETIFTEAKMKDFQKHTNFGNISMIEGLFKKVMEADANDATKFKVKADFIATLKKEDAEVDDLAKMITKLSAEKIIKLIHFFDYEKKAEKEKKELRRKFSWEREKKVNDKFVGENEDYPLPENEKENFTNFLYQLAIGQKSLSSISKPTENEKDKTGNDQETGFLAHLKRNKITYTISSILLAIGIGATIYFWDKIKGFWDPKEQGGENSDDE
ncbi:MAG: hypothetical protein I3270_02525 [Candidatus Moeniiplasma glomeromycotorum]|nr:hypothetical protein [Candidatus Moeniiplasma glomeromycotorum]MCE8162578.1 hypothetical protein [Candidatus Moeniiplasma glomeromycotorum]MCE8166498.1 hypothetical protein [Candidatus Moeniiplasma glomeromycotorum]MCE8166961.1 hypothetical protein [Candidatus Moeniiplasma glomeromycotorum]